MGPLTSAQHRERVLAYVKIAKEQGGELLLGGGPPADENLAGGYYLQPTVMRARPAGLPTRPRVSLLLSR